MSDLGPFYSLFWLQHRDQGQEQNLVLGLWSAFNLLQKWPFTSVISGCDIKIKNLLLTSFSNFWSILPRFLCYRIHIIATCKENRGIALTALGRVRNDNSSPQVPPLCSLWMGTRLPGRYLCQGVYRALPEPYDYYWWTATTTLDAARGSRAETPGGAVKPTGEIERVEANSLSGGVHTWIYIQTTLHYGPQLCPYKDLMKISGSKHYSHTSVLGRTQQYRIYCADKVTPKGVSYLHPASTARKTSVYTAALPAVIVHSQGTLMLKPQHWL